MNWKARVNESATESRPLNFGPDVGRFLGKGIPAWIRMEDGLYAFEGVAPGPEAGIVDLSLLGQNEIALYPGLLYRLV
jgi:hypothetical protein